MSGPRRIAAWAAAIPLLAGAAQSSAQEVRDAWFAETATAAGSSLEQLTNDRHQVFFITELLDLQGHTVRHRWEHGGEIRWEVPYVVKASPWRVSSSMTLRPQWLGEWTASVLDEDGNVLRREMLEYVEAEGDAPRVQIVLPRAPVPEPQAPVEEPDTRGATSSPAPTEPPRAEPAQPESVPPPAPRPPRLGVRDDPRRLWRERR